MLENRNAGVKRRIQQHGIPQMNLATVRYTTRLPESLEWANSSSASMWEERKSRAA